MFSSFERRLILRYLWPGPGGRLTLLIAAIGCVGITIGVASLVLVVSFMNGAEARLATQISSVDGHLSVTRAGHQLADWRTLRHAIAQTRGIAAVVPTLESPGMVTVAGRVAPVELQGLQPGDIRSGPLFTHVGALVMGGAPVAQGSVAIGSGLATRLGLLVGDPLAITSVSRGPDGNFTVDNVGFVVTGIIKSEVATFDDRRVILRADSLRRLLRRTADASVLNVTVSNPDQTDAIAAVLRARLGSETIVRTWQQANAMLFGALAQERLAMATIMSMVTIIALSNILSSMVMLVRFKTREIAILRTMGAGPGSIARVFVAVAAAIGLAGELAGLGLGLGLKAAKGAIVGVVRTGMTHPPHELDVLLGLPLTISTAEILWIVGGVTAGVVASTCYPAIKAAAIDPATVLRQG